MAALADLGVVLLTLVAVLLIGVSLGIALAPQQLAVSCAAAVLVVGAIGTGALWGWRATPGMLLLGLRFRAPLAVGRAQGVWLAWMCALAVAGLPLLVGRRGRTVAEQLGGCEIVSH